MILLKIIMFSMTALSILGHMAMIFQNLLLHTTYSIKIEKLNLPPIYFLMPLHKEPYASLE